MKVVDQLYIANRFRTKTASQLPTWVNDKNLFEYQRARQAYDDYKRRGISPKHMTTGRTMEYFNRLKSEDEANNAVNQAQEIVNNPQLYSKEKVRNAQERLPFLIAGAGQQVAQQPLPASRPHSIRNRNGTADPSTTRAPSTPRPASADASIPHWVQNESDLYDYQRARQAYKEYSENGKNLSAINTSGRVMEFYEKIKAEGDAQGAVSRAQNVVNNPQLYAPDKVRNAQEFLRSKSITSPTTPAVAVPVQQAAPPPHVPRNDDYARAIKTDPVTGQKGGRIGKRPDGSWGFIPNPNIQQEVAAAPAPIPTPTTAAPVAAAPLPAPTPPRPIASPIPNPAAVAAPNVGAATPVPAPAAPAPRPAPAPVAQTPAKPAPVAQAPTGNSRIKPVRPAAKAPAPVAQAPAPAPAPLTLPAPARPTRLPANVKAPVLGAAAPPLSLPPAARPGREPANVVTTPPAFTPPRIDSNGMTPFTPAPRPAPPVTQAPEHQIAASHLRPPGGSSAPYPSQAAEQIPMDSAPDPFTQPPKAPPVPMIAGADTAPVARDHRLPPVRQAPSALLGQETQPPAVPSPPLEDNRTAAIEEFNKIEGARVPKSENYPPITKPGQSAAVQVPTIGAAIP